MLRHLSVNHIVCWTAVWDTLQAVEIFREWSPNFDWSEVQMICMVQLMPLPPHHLLLH